MKRVPGVCVLMGGPSAEHAISLKSGQGVAGALTRRGWEPDALIIPFDVSLEDAVDWTRQALRRIDPEVVFIALHGSFGEDGTIQTLCEEMQVAYTGSDPEASRLGMDKVVSRERLSRSGLRVPRGHALTRDLSGAFQVPDSIVRGIGPSAPMIVKPSDQGSSIGVSRITSPEELPAALDEAARYSGTVLVEEYVAGREVTVSVVGGRALPVVEIVPKCAWFDFSAKYTQGLTDYFVPAVLPTAVTAAVQDAGRRAHEIIGCRHFSRTDMILNNAHEPVILEVNTIPGLTPTSLLPKAAAAVGISYDELCERLVLIAQEARPLQFKDA